MTFPDKFHIKTKWSELKYTLRRNNHPEDGWCWLCTEYGKTPQPYHATYYELQIERNLASGDWIRLCYTENGLEEDRPLKFPFVVDVSGNKYEVSGGTGGWVNLHGITDASFRFVNGFTVERVKRFIKDGMWRVISVGEQKPVKAPASDEHKCDVLTAKIDAKDAAEAAKTVVEAMQDYSRAAKQLEDVMRNTVKAMSSMFGGDNG